MKQITWTGHPFVDAGLSAIATIVADSTAEVWKATMATTPEG